MAENNLGDSQNGMSSGPTAHGVDSVQAGIDHLDGAGVICDNPDCDVVIAKRLVINFFC